ncbi:MAG: pyridine nucleotide-disulfide oxidoreductase [Thermoprotei archaeon]|nr:MAG: pyridine nucleotide-disulfide oxidoreductase [Thermoprotei archaeon]
MKIVIIGYGTAGMTAAGYARVTNRKASIIVFERRSYAVYHPCSLPDLIAGSLERSAVVEEAPRMPNLVVHTSTIVEEVDVSGRKVRARDLRSGKVIEEEYDALILATGSKPYIPRAIRVEDSRGVYTLKVVEDAEAISGVASKYSSAVVVGGSALGIEVAYALRKRGLKVTLVEYFPQLMPGKLDPELAERVAHFLSSAGVEVMLGKGVAEVGGPEGEKKVTTADGETLEAGFVVMATGVRPDVELAKQMGLEIGETGGVRVDEFMRTSIEGVYAAGDVAEVKDLITGKPTLSLFASTALLMGRVAGINAAGGREEFRGVLQNWVVNLEGFKFGAVGLTEQAARKAGIDVMTATVTAPEKPRFYPGYTEVTIKLVVERDEGRVVGAQVLGRGEVVEKLNLLSVAIARGLTISELPHLEFAYTPSLNEVVHPIYVAADAILRRFKRLRRG